MIGFCRWRLGASLVLVAALPALAACSTPTIEPTSASPHDAQIAGNADDRDCLTRAMYFESHRSSETGLLAVGTVVMNRVASPKFPDTVCGVVGQPRQFASGVLSRPMDETARAEIAEVADAVLAGARHEPVKDAMFFHQAGLTFSYNNMHYVTVAGGNAFYKKL